MSWFPNESIKIAVKNNLLQKDAKCCKIAEAMTGKEYANGVLLAFGALFVLNMVKKGASGTKGTSSGSGTIGTIGDQYKRSSWKGVVGKDGKAIGLWFILKDKSGKFTYHARFDNALITGSASSPEGAAAALVDHLAGYRVAAYVTVWNAWKDPGWEGRLHSLDDYLKRLP